MISAAMIVRNEENNLDRCLKSIQNIADEIVIIDTGSTDKTVEIAQNYKTKIFHETWIDDFSYHRNHSIRKCSNDWILIIDADEEFIGNKADIAKWLKRMPKNASCAVVDIQDMQNGEVYMNFNSARIFRKDEVQYKNIVHNRPMFPGKAVFCPLVSIKHYGYDLDDNAQDKKYHRCMNLLKTRLTKNPKDWDVYFYMAQVLPKKQKFKAALACCLIYIKHKKEVERFNESIWFTLLQLALKLNDQKTIDDYFRQALDALPYDVDVSYAVMEYGILKKDPEIISEGAARYIMAYDMLAADPVIKQTRFIYCANAKNLSMALYQLSLIRLNDGLRLLERLKLLMIELPDDFREMAEKDLSRELLKIGIKWISKEAA